MKCLLDRGDSFLSFFSPVSLEEYWLTFSLLHESQSLVQLLVLRIDLFIFHCLGYKIRRLKEDVNLRALPFDLCCGGMGQWSERAGACSRFRKRYSCSGGDFSVCHYVLQWFVCCLLLGKVDKNRLRDVQNVTFVNF